jgi:hypothetical protein
MLLLNCVVIYRLASIHDHGKIKWFEETKKIRSVTPEPAVHPKAMKCNDKVGGGDVPPALFSP